MGTVAADVVEGHEDADDDDDDAKVPKTKSKRWQRLLNHKVAIWKTGGRATGGT